MLIDQFSPEQLDQIRRELKMIQKISKATYNEEIKNEVMKVFDTKSYHDNCIFPYSAVTEAISTIVDYTLDNFVYKKQGRAKKQIGWYRSNMIPKDKEEEYKQMQHELLDIVKKHKTQKEFSLRKPEDLK